MVVGKDIEVVDSENVAICAIVDKCDVDFLSCPAFERNRVGGPLWRLCIGGEDGFLTEIVGSVARCRDIDRVAVAVLCVHSVCAPREDIVLAVDGNGRGDEPVVGSGRVGVPRAAASHAVLLIGARLDSVAHPSDAILETIFLHAARRGVAVAVECGESLRYSLLKVARESDVLSLDRAGSSQ